MNKERREELLDVIDLLEEAKIGLAKSERKKKMPCIPFQRDFKNLPEDLRCKTLWTLSMDLLIQ